MKQLIALLLCAFSFSAFSQTLQTVTTNGSTTNVLTTFSNGLNVTGSNLLVPGASSKVGINTWFPETTLDVRGTIYGGYPITSIGGQSSTLRSGYFSFYAAELASYIPSTAPGLDFVGWKLRPYSYTKGGNYDALTLTPTGDLGIGTTTPQAKIEVLGNPTHGGNGTNFKASGNSARLTVDFNSTGQNLYDAAIHSFRNYAGTTFMTITNTGNVGIGTTTPPTAYKLAVNGDAIATRMVVKLNANWPDYVFQPNYELPPLSKIALFIKENGHLPEMPTEIEVAKNGIDVGSMNEKLLKKVEELTLYLIEQQKQIDALKEAIKALKN